MPEEESDQHVGLDHILSHTSSQVRPFHPVNARHINGRSSWLTWLTSLELPVWMVLVVLVLLLGVGWWLRPQTVQLVEQPARSVQAADSNSLKPTVPATAPPAVAQQPNATPSPTLAPSPTPTPQPTATPQPAPTATPIPATPTPVVTAPSTLLPITNPWLGNGLRLSMQNEPEDAGRTRVNFLATNTSAATLNFLVPFGAFFIEIAGQRFVGHDQNTDVVVFGDFKPGQQNQRAFHVDFDVDWKQFQMLKARRDAASYKIGVTGFGDGIPNAEWEEMLYH